MNGPRCVSEHEYEFDSRNPYMQVAKTKESLFVFPDGVRLMASTLKTGINRSSEKRWWRWEQSNTRGIRASSTGLLVPYGRRGSGKFRRYSPGLAFAPLDRAFTTVDVAYSNELAAKFNVRSLRDIYPMAHHFGIDQYDRIPSGLHMALRQSSGVEFAKAAFGRSLYRRDLVKASCSAEPWAIAVSREFRGLVPPDWIVGGLRGSANHGRPTIRTRGLRSALRSLDHRSLRHLVNDLRRDVPDLLGDILRMNLGQRLYVRSYAQWHDELATGWRKTSQIDMEIPQTKLAQRLHGLQIGDMEMRTAQSTAEMGDWGRAMHNCIGSYTHAALSGRGVYAAVYRAGGMVANLEVAGSKLNQLLGRFNQRLSDADRVAIEASLVSEDVHVTKDYWGSAAA